MKPTIKERLFWVALPALAVVLAALAVLQYHWSEQVSAATRAQMQSNLQTSLLGFRQDLSRELGAVCLELRPAADDSGSLRTAEFSQQFRHWQQTAAHPTLVTQVYLWRNSGSGEPTMLRLDPAHDQAETVAWPTGFDPLRQILLSMSSPAGHPMGGVVHQHQGHGRNRSGGHGGHSMDLFLPWFVDQSIPALVYPLRRRPTPQHAKSARAGDPATPQHAKSARAGDPAGPAAAAALPAVTWIIIQLNTGVLQKEILPDLAQKYFRGPAGFDYHVAVLAGGRNRVLYSTDPGFTDAKDVAFDAALNLFGPPFRRTDSPGPQADQFAPPLRSAPGPFGRPGTPDERRSAGGERMVRFEPLPSREEGAWQIVVKHQRGSVEAAVSDLRRRHLMVSFGVLVLLAVTMALVLIASQRARRLAALQMNFVAGVSHELRTPLAVISSAADNIAHGVVADPQQMARYGVSILKQTRQLTQLVEQVLFFAATQQKLGHYQLRPVDAARVIDAALENTAGMAAAAGVAVERSIEPGLPAVAADFAALSQCLQNLITNAIKYSGDGHWMGVRAISRRENGAAREIEITVQDKGIGISPQEIKHIFQPFYRSPAVAGSNVHGTGLGLPLARSVIEAMRGRLTVESQPGRGSAFTIHLSLAAGLRLPDQDAAAESIPGETAGYYP